MSKYTEEQSYVNEIQSLDAEIKRLNTHLKRLREQRNHAKRHLYECMVRSNKKKVGKYTLKSVTPKEAKPPCRPMSQRKAEAYTLFERVGIPDPDAFWKQFQETQKARIE